MKNKTILIADDEQWILQILEKKFKREGFQTLVAKNGREAVSLARLEKPDCILLDIKMPELDGLEACRILKKSEDTWHIPVIVLSAKAERFDKRAGMAAGADHYLTKPMRFKDILDNIIDILTHLKFNKTKPNTKLTRSIQ